MLSSQTKLVALSADKVLYKLCKHFALKIPVEFDAENANIQFPIGGCTLHRDGDHLHVQCSADDADKLAKLEHVLQDHLGLMLKDPTLVLRWRALDHERHDSKSTK
ncbi:DUF2218 domain-containing protein [Deefgea rivuli]|uniref:DUF2218 domain-containing protein n=1 Tax=Deefgea rivuli TaxID=400948 RepID=UPI0006875815|nr:DUF2218 domain-containing protein [Deefgea rivuli]